MIITPRYDYDLSSRGQQNDLGNYRDTIEGSFDSSEEKSAKSKSTIFELELKKAKMRERKSMQ